MGSQAKRLKQSDSFLKKLFVMERRAWESFVSVVKGFLGNYKVPNFKDIVEELVHMRRWADVAKASHSSLVH